MHILLFSQYSHTPIPPIHYLFLFHMAFLSLHDFPFLETIPHPFNFNSCFFSTQETHQMMEVSLSQFEGFPGLDFTHELPYSSKKLCFNEFPDIENFNFDLEEVEQKPLNIVVPEGDNYCNSERDFGDSFVAIENGFEKCVKKNEVEKIHERRLLQLPEEVASGSSSIRKKRTCVLEFEEIKKHFDVPITEAAKKMNVGLTMLKRRCRELNIKRWPHRKLKSLQLLIDNVKEMGLAKEVVKLEKHKRMLEKLPGLELNKEAKKLRQACFKANYKKRRSLALQA